MPVGLCDGCGQDYVEVQWIPGRRQNLCRDCYALLGYEQGVC